MINIAYNLLSVKIYAGVMNELTPPLHVPKAECCRYDGTGVVRKFVITG